MANENKTPLIVDEKFILPYWEGKKYHKNYYRAIDAAFHLQFHFDGYFLPPIIFNADGTERYRDEFLNPYFTRLIDDRRPAESEVTRMYRRKRYQPITKEPCGKVVNSLRKITKSADWHISYTKSEVPAGLPEKDSLQNYCEKDYPKDGSVENWARKTLIRWMLIDPNAVICVFPLSWEEEENEYLEPYAHIIKSKDVLDYRQDEYLIFKSPYENCYEKNGSEINGKILMVVTEESFFEVKEIDNGKFSIEEYAHNIGEIPAWIVGGEMKNTDIKCPFYESFVHPMLPYLDNAAIDSSDLDAEKVQHLFSTMWFMQSSPCSNCEGNGKVLQGGKQIICPTCSGRGGAPFSPYRNLEVNMNSNGLAPDKQLPIPPAGYIEKSTEMVSKMMEIIDGEKYSALASINFEFLADTPLNQSGKAKEVDRDELNNFVYGVAQNLVNDNLNPAYYFINEMRYMKAVPNPEQRKKMLPQIPVPENYDFLTSKDAEDKLVKISESNVSEELKDIAEMTYINSKYQDQPELIARLTVIHTHDPFPEKTPEELNSLVMGGLIKKEDAVLSLYIKVFVTEQLADDEDFLKMDFEAQSEILMKMAEEKAKELSAQDQIKRQADAKAKAKADAAAGNGDPKPKGK